MELKVNHQLDLNDWENFISNSPFNSPFQCPAFYTFINSLATYKAFVFSIVEQNNIQALCLVTIQKEKGIKGFFSKRAIIYGGPVFTENKEAADYLLKNISKNLKGVIYIETRNFYDYSGYKKVFELNGWQYEKYLNFHLDCSSEQIAQQNFNSNRKRQIKKAFSSGVELEEARSITEVEKYYQILYTLYKSKIKKPLPPLSFFEKFYESNLGKILLVKFKNKIIGGIVCPILKNQSIYEFYICGLDAEFKDQSPSVMATYAAIQYGFKNNLKRFDFMGAGKPDEDYGVRDFKAKFGGELVEHGRFVKINNKALYAIGKSALAFLKKTK
jgi:serine/alanine adding enzyme